MNAALHPMKEIMLEKITLNMGNGDIAQRLEASKKVLSLLTGKKIVVTKTSRRTTFGMPKGKAIGVMVTLRGRDAEVMLKKLLEAVEKKIKPSQFDAQGNFSFGIKEYIHIPGASYDPDIGILGLDVAVTLTRRGFRVKRRKLRSSPVGKKHRITREEAIEWAQRFGFNVTDKEEEYY